METIRIRRAGYPIRHRFNDFVDRYRLLANGIQPSHKENCREASVKICKSALNGDFQIGKTKVFLKVSVIIKCKFGLIMIFWVAQNKWQLSLRLQHKTKFHKMGPYCYYGYKDNTIISKYYKSKWYTIFTTTKK